MPDDTKPGAKAVKKAWRTRRARRSTKGALIKGMSRRLPSEILESEVFAEQLKTMMRRYAGIYALYRGKRLYYVGLTKNLLGRIKWHLKDRHKGKWDSLYDIPHSAGPILERHRNAADPLDRHARE